MRYPSNNADFFNTGDFNTNTNNANKNTFSVENTNNAVNTNNNNLHQRKSSSSMPSSSSSMNALPTHMRNRSSGGFGGGSGNTPTTINFGSTSSSSTGGAAGQTTPPTNFATAYTNPQRQPSSLGFDNTTTFLGGTTNSADFGTNSGNGNVNSSDLFGGGGVVNNNNTTSTSINNQVAMGRQQSSNIDSFDEENEPPLLEELGIRPDHIRDKVKLVLNPFSQVTSSHELCMDEDLAGPITFVVALGFLLTLQGKVHFGAIYGTSVVGILLSYFLLTMMSREVPVRTTLVVSTLGYCLLPDLLLAIFVTLHLAFVGGGSVGVFLPVLCFVTVSWSAWCAMKIFAEAFQLHHARYLILYPSFLFYAVFAAITMF